MSDALLAATVAPAVETPAAAAPAAAVEAPAGNAGEATIGKWVEQASPEHRGYEFLKGKAKIDDLILHTKTREEEIAKLSEELAKVPKKPGADAKPEEIAAWRTAQGLALKADDYQFDKSELPSNPEIDNFYRETFMELDLPVGTAKALYAKVAAKGQALLTAQLEARKAESEAATAALRQTYKQDFDANMKTITDFGKANFGDKTWAKIEASGLGNDMDFASVLLTMGKEFGTAKFIKGTSSGQTEEKSAANVLFPSLK